MARIMKALIALPVVLTIALSVAACARPGDSGNTDAENLLANDDAVLDEDALSRGVIDGNERDYDRSEQGGHRSH